MRRSSIYIKMIPTMAEFQVEETDNIKEIDVIFYRTQDYVVLSSPESEIDLAVHKDQIEDLRQVLDDCRDIFTEIEDRQAAEAEESQCDEEETD